MARIISRSTRSNIAIIGAFIGALAIVGNVRVHSQSPFIVFGSNSGVAQPITSTSNALNVKIAAGSTPTMTSLTFSGSASPTINMTGNSNLDIETAGTGNVRFGTNGGIKWFINGTGNANDFSPASNDALNIGESGTARIADIFRTGVTKAASQAAGGTVNLDSDIVQTRYQMTIAPAVGDCSTAFNAAALTADCTIATLPAGSKLVAAYADVTTGFTCSGTCTGTKTFSCGVSAGGTTIFTSNLSVATGSVQFGLADADMGTSMVRSAAIQGGYLPSWTATSPVSCRFTSGTGNWGSGAATFVNAGAVKFTLLTEQLK